jgi:hypothetical protein
MKRAIAVGILAVTASAAIAATNVVSVNVVGYNKTTAPGVKYVMVAQPFYQMGNTSIQNVMTNQLTGGANAGTSDNVIFYDNAAQAYLPVNYYRASDSSWRQGFSASTQNVDQGRCFWIKTITNADQQVTFLGEVVTDPTVTQAVYQGYNMLAYPYNTTKPVTNTALHAVAVAGANAGTADQIITYDAATQTYSTYYKKSTDNQWYKGFSQSTPDLKMGEAFWFLRRSSGTVAWAENVPYSL